MRVLAKGFLFIMSLVGIIASTMILWAYKDIGTLTIVIIVSALTNLVIISLKVINDNY